jgi:hypothetical protein
MGETKEEDKEASAMELDGLELDEGSLDDELDFELELPPLGDGPEELGLDSTRAGADFGISTAEDEPLSLDDSTGALDPIEPTLIADLMAPAPMATESFLEDDRVGTGFPGADAEAVAAESTEYGWLQDSGPSGIDDYVADLGLESEGTAVLDDGGVLSIAELLGEDALPLAGEE